MGSKKVVILNSIQVKNIDLSLTLSLQGESWGERLLKIA